MAVIIGPNFDITEHNAQWILVWYDRKSRITLFNHQLVNWFPVETNVSLKLFPKTTTVDRFHRIINGLDVSYVYHIVDYVLCIN